MFLVSGEEKKNWMDSKRPQDGGDWALERGVYFDLGDARELMYVLWESQCSDIDRENKWETAQDLTL